MAGTNSTSGTAGHKLKDIQVGVSGSSFPNFGSAAAMPVPLTHGKTIRRKAFYCFIITTTHFVFMKHSLIM